MEETYVPNNYGPISLTSHVCKVLESIICNHIIAFLSDKNISLLNNMVQFTYQKFCFTNLLKSFEDRTPSNDQGYSIDVVFLSFKKPLIAFHTRGC